MPPESPYSPRRSKLGIIITVVVVLCIIAGLAFYFRDSIPFLQGGAPPAEEPLPSVPEEQTYTSPSMGISVRYPQDYTLGISHVYPFGQKEILGIKLTVPESMATGTNLAAGSYISIEQLPRALNCTGDIYLLSNVRAAEVIEGAVTYSVASSTEGAAGSRYEEQVWALKGSKPCTAVRYYIHTTELGNDEPGTVGAYNRATLLADFDAIRRSLTLAAAATSTPTP